MVGKITVMTRSIRHAHSKRALARSASQRSASHDSATTGDASQRTGIAAPQAEPSKKRGRKPGSQTKLAMPLRGAKVALRPSGGQQFSYVIYKPPYKYSSQLGVILRREYPGLVEDKDEDGRVIGDPRIALDWGDYFLSSPNELGVTSGDRVLSEFWRLFEVASDEQQEADRVLETYLKKRVKDLIYQARVECVKEYHWKQRGQVLDDTLDRSIELEYEQYFLGKLKWCNYEVWPKLCQYWCSEDFKKKRKIGQDCRLGTEDNAQNHGGSRPFTETQQVMKARFGPEKATPLNVYAVMKSGINGVDSNGNSGPIRSRKAQKRMDDYIAGVRTACVEDEDEELEEIEDEEEGKEQRRWQEPEQEQHLNGKVLYEMAGGTPHGRFPIANGAVRAADCRAAAKENRAQPSNSVSMQSMARENAGLRSTNARLQQQVLQKDSALQECNVATDLILELGKVIPDKAVQRLSAARAMATGSSHVASESINNSMDVDGHEGEDLGGTTIHANQQSRNNELCDDAA